MKMQYGLVLLVCAIFAPLVGLCADPVGQVVSLQGSATATGADGKSRDLALQSQVFQNDRIATAKDSKIQILFADDSIISQGENSLMTIDEYVYAPEKEGKERGTCSIGLAKGVFRVLTGKITEINPDRFKVKTRMATIGIRGCDVGFTVTEQGTDVYVIEIHGQERIVVQARPNVGGGEWNGLVEGKWDDAQVAKQHLINVLKPNRVVSIVQGEGVTQRELTPDELVVLIEAVTPVNNPPVNPLAGEGDQGSGDGSGSGADDDSGSGTDDGSGSGTDDGSGSGTDDGSGSGTDDGSGSGTDDGSGSGADDDSGSGTDDDSGSGTDDGSSGGADDDSGSGTEDGSGSGTDDGSGSGTDDGAGTDTGDGSDGSFDLGGNNGGDGGSGDFMGDGSGIGGNSGDNPGGVSSPGGSAPGTGNLIDDLAALALQHQNRVNDAISSGNTAALLALLGDPMTTGAQRVAIQAKLTEMHQVLVDAAISAGDKTALLALLGDPDTTPEQIAAIQARLDAIARAEHDAALDKALASGDKAALQAFLNDPLTTSAQRDAINLRLQELAAPVFRVKNSGNYWSWGVWDKEGVVNAVEARSGRTLTASDFQALANGAVLYTLTGSGDAAAIITHAGAQSLVMGFADPVRRANNGVTGFGCNINIQLGKSVTPTWDGTFSMDNASGDILRFDIPGGAIQGTGELTGTPAFYSMKVRNTPYDKRSIASENVSGVLVGPGGGALPTGTIGNFRFSHNSVNGNIADVTGIYATNLAP